MHEIGGYIEFEQYQGPMLHEDGIKLDSGRSCLAYLIRAKNIRKIAMPSFMCDSVLGLCAKYNIELRFYRVGRDFLPEDVFIDDDEFFYLMNYYGQLDCEIIKSFHKKYHRVIVDNAQGYFDEPVPGVDTIYTSRKFFGVPDGGILYTDSRLDENLERSESWPFMIHLLGRYERNASEFFHKSIENNDRLTDQPIRKMSKLTENLLHGIDYEHVKSVRSRNYQFLSEFFKPYNKLNLKKPEGPFAFPLMIDNAPELRKELISKKIYIPVLWPKTANQYPEDKILSTSILPLPCDQRYTEDDMQYLCDSIVLQIGKK